MTQAEEMGYEEEYFPVVQEDIPAAPHDPSEYILSHSPPTHDVMMDAMDSVVERSGDQPEGPDNLDISERLVTDGRGHIEETEFIATSPTEEFHLVADRSDFTPKDPYAPEPVSPEEPRGHNYQHPPPPSRHRRRRSHASHNIAEAVFFSYGVSVFFGFQAGEERTIMTDCDVAGTWQQGLEEDDWEVEEFHYTVSKKSESD